MSDYSKYTRQELYDAYHKQKLGPAESPKAGQSLIVDSFGDCALIKEEWIKRGLPEDDLIR